MSCNETKLQPKETMHRLKTYAETALLTAAYHVLVKKHLDEPETR